jgi:hypothetical protein
MLALTFNFSAEYFSQPFGIIHYNFADTTGGFSSDRASIIVNIVLVVNWMRLVVLALYQSQRSPLNMRVISCHCSPAILRPT